MEGLVVNCATKALERDKHNIIMVEMVTYENNGNVNKVRLKCKYIPWAKMNMNYNIEMYFEHKINPNNFELYFISHQTTQYYVKISLCTFYDKLFKKRINWIAVNINKINYE